MSFKHIKRGTWDDNSSRAWVAPVIKIAKLSSAIFEKPLISDGIITFISWFALSIFLSASPKSSWSSFFVVYYLSLFVKVWFAVAKTGLLASDYSYWLWFDMVSFADFVNSDMLCSNSSLSDFISVLNIPSFCANYI